MSQEHTEKEKEKAGAYVREKLPELMELSFGCILKSKEIPDAVGVHIARVRQPNSEDTNNEYKVKKFLVTQDALYEAAYSKEHLREHFAIIGHPIQLQHWLSTLEDRKHIAMTMHGDDYLVFYSAGGQKIRFDLTTGQPAAELDYKAFNDIVGI